jgi:dephospho-CoA kinase
MLNVGLTGNIGAGKSTVARWLREWGATLIDADELVREVQLPGSTTLRAIAREFGDDILKPDGSLDREVLRTKAMRDAHALNALNEIVHPAVQQRRAERALLAEEHGDCVLVNDIPLLFEVLDPASFDVVILVDAPEALRCDRIMRERGLTPEIAERMIAAQLPAEEKRAGSGIVLDNAGTLEELEAATRAAWRDIRKRAAAGLTTQHGSLLAIATDQREAVHAFGGTLARYADAGVETWLACVGAGATATEVEPLGLSGTLVLASAAGAGDPESLVGALTRVIHERSPGVTIAPGPTGERGLGLCEMARRAWDQADAPGMLFCTARTQTGTATDARLDVRPWRDVRAAALTVLGEADRATASEAPEREAFAAATPAKRVLVDLFQAVD